MKQRRARRKHYNWEVEIAKLEKRIDRLKKQSAIVSDVVQNGYKRHAIYGGDGATAARWGHSP